MIQNIIIIAALVILVGVAILAIVLSKKSGKKCIGCPESGCSECTCCHKK